MSKSILYLKFVVIIFLITLTYSCNKKNCEIDSRMKFIGDWHANDYGCNGLNHAEVAFNIDDGATLKEVLINFPSGGNLFLKGTYEGDVINIPFQDYGTTYQGTLRLISQDIMTLDLDIDNNIALLSCQATLKRD